MFMITTDIQNNSFIKAFVQYKINSTARNLQEMTYTCSYTNEH